MNRICNISIFTQISILMGLLVFSAAVRADLISLDSPYGTATHTLDTDPDLS